MKTFYNILYLLLLIVVSQNSFAQWNTTFVGQIDYEAGANDIWGFEKNSREYALVGLQNGFSIVDISNASEPEELFFVAGVNTTWRDVKTFQERAYVVNDNSTGMLIVDLSNLPTAIDTVTWTGGLWQDEMIVHENAHNIFIDENGIAYLCGTNDDSTLMLDLNIDPINPPIVGRYDDAYVHDLFVRNDTMWTAQVYAGNFAVVDISDKENYNVLATQTTPNNFTHNLWLSNNGKHLFTTDEKGGSFITAYDVSDLDNIEEIDRYQSSYGMGVIPHNVFVEDNFLIASYYRDGVRILDATYPYNLIEVAYYDTSPFPPATGFQGCWGVYPYLASQKMIASDRQEGLVIFDADYQQAAYVEGTVTNATTNAPLANVQITINDSLNYPTQTDFSGFFATGFAESGTYTLTAEVYGFETQNITVNFVNGELIDLDIALEPIEPFTLNIQLTNIFTGETINDALVKIAHEPLGFSANTNENGVASFDLFYFDDYEIQVGKWGFRNQIINQFFDENNTFIEINLVPEYYDDFSLDLGWSVSGDALNGHWERAVPLGVEFIEGFTTPLSDIDSDIGDFCYVTGNENGISNNVNDGTTILQSPIMDLSNYTNPILSYYRYCYFQAASEDLFVAKIDNGIETAILETVQEGDATETMWHQASFNLAEHIELTENMRFIIEVSDLAGAAHVVDASFDGFRVAENAILPTASFTSSTTAICANENIVFVNTSENFPSHLTWYFEGGEPSESTSFSPAINYSESGIYNVTLVVSNEAGQDSITLNEFVTIFETAQPTINVSSSEICVGETVTIIAENENIDSWLWEGNDISFDTPQAISVSPLENETYMLTTTDENGCISQNTIDIVVNQLPAFEIEAPNGSVEICLGDEITLIVNPNIPFSNYTYSWSGENLSHDDDIITVATPTTNGIYEVIATDENGCQASQSIEILVNSSSVSILAEEIVCAETVFSLTAIGEGTGTLTYTWAGESLLQNEGETVTALAENISWLEQSYQVTMIDETGCATTNYIEVTIEICDGIAEEKAAYEIKVFPNPANEVLFVTLKNEENSRSIVRLYNILGKKVCEKTYQNDILTLDISELPNGAYFLQIEKDSSFVTQKVIISQ
ncbi:MAG: choice-of-anchor B family protein [Chitinophagales bacterium]